MSRDRGDPWPVPGLSWREGQGGFLEAAINPLKRAYAVAVQLLGVGKWALDGFLPTRVDPFFPIGQAVGVGSISGVLPDMAGDERALLALLVHEAGSGQPRQVAGSLL